MESSNISRKNRRLETVSVDTVQFILARGVKLHPLLYKDFLDMIMELEFKDRVCPLPITHLQHFNNRIAEKLGKNHPNSLKMFKIL